MQKFPFASISSLGIIKGKDGGAFDPQGMATRAEVTAMLHRFAEMAKPGQT